jgi:predicted Zn-dependent peptidase
VQTRLGNGLRLVFQSNPASPVVAICAFVHTSAAQETFNGAGVRELLQLMGERTLVRPDQPPEAQPPVLELNTSLSRDYVEMVALCLPDEVDQVLPRLRWALFDPYLSQESLRAGQERLRLEVAGRQSLATNVALDVLVARLYPDWPGSWPLVGTGGATLADLDYVTAFHTQHYLANGTLLAVAGPGEWTALRGQVEQTFGNLLPGRPEQLLPPPVGAEPQSGSTELRMRGSDVSAVVMGGRGPSLVDPDYAAASVLMSILGTGRGSRLYHRLREEQSLSYTIQAGVTPSQVCPYVYVAATCGADQIRDVQRALGGELRKLTEQPPEEAEVVRARRALWGQYQLQQQDNEQLAHYLGLFALLDETQGTVRWSSLPLRLAAVRPEQVQAQARACFGTPVTVVVRGQSSGSS